MARRNGRESSGAGGEARRGVAGSSRPAQASGGRANGQLLLEVQGLKKYYPIRRGFLRKVVGQVRAVDDVSFDIRRGETLALVGESGCGKTTTSRCILRAITPTAGRILFRTDGGAVVDVATLPRERLRPLRRQMQMIFQDPYSSLNPRMTILDIVGEPLLVNGVKDRQERMRAGRGVAQAGRPAAGVHAPLPARLQRRPAPADRHCPRPGAQPEAGRRRRAGLGARRLGPGADPQPAARPPGRSSA